MKLLFVCLENVCRSPIAKAITLTLARERNVAGLVVDSAGLSPSLKRAPMDPRARTALERAGLAIPVHKSRAVSEDDFARSDLVIAMDRQVLWGLQALADEQAGRKLSLLSEWMAEPAHPDVPDPYFGPAAGFDEVVRLCRLGVLGLLEALSSGATDPPGRGAPPGRRQDTS